MLSNDVYKFCSNNAINSSLLTPLLLIPVIAIISNQISASCY